MSAMRTRDSVTMSDAFTVATAVLGQAGDLETADASVALVEHLVADLTPDALVMLAAVQAHLTAHLFEELERVTGVDYLRRLAPRYAEPGGHGSGPGED